MDRGGTWAGGWTAGGAWGRVVGRRCTVTPAPSAAPAWGVGGTGRTVYTDPGMPSSRYDPEVAKAVAEDRPPPLVPAAPADPLVPADGDTALIHDLRRRLAVDVLAGAERGDMATALATLREIALSGDSDKVRGKAAADLARVLSGTAHARPAQVQVGTVNVVTAADLVTGVDPAAVRAAMAALAAQRAARVVDAVPLPRPPSPSPGSDRGAPPAGEGSPFPGVTGEPRPRPIPQAPPATTPPPPPGPECPW